MEYVKKYLPLALLVINALAGIVSPAVQGFWEHHTNVASLLAALAVFFPQPHK